MVLPLTKTTTLGITCPRCTQLTPETAGVLFSGAELECSHCGAVIDIRSGSPRKYINWVFDACQSADEADDAA